MVDVAAPITSTEFPNVSPETTEENGTADIPKENGHSNGVAEESIEIEENGTETKENGTSTENGHDTKEQNGHAENGAGEESEEPVAKKGKKTPAKGKDLKPMGNRRSSSRLVNIDSGDKLPAEITSDNLKHLK